MDFFPVFIVALLAVWTTWFQLRRQRRATKLPPGPYPFPIIGNILQLGKSPHQSLAQLAKTYGPLMSLHLGRVYTVVVSSPEMARDILQKHGQTFSSRTITGAAQAHDHAKHSMTFLPPENQWKKLRRLSQEQMFTVARLEASQGLRQEKLHELYEYVSKCRDTRRTVNIGEAVFITAINLMSATLFSTQATDFDSGETHEFMAIFGNLTDVVAAPNVADFFPVLKPIDPQGILRKSVVVFGKVLEYLENMINQKLEARKKSELPKKTDLLETLLDLREGTEYSFSIEDIKHLLLDLLVAGTETTSTTVEWAMTELLLSPETLSKAKEELKTVIGENKLPQESDISKLPYLQAVIKEVFRLHPPGPFLLPRKSDEEVQVSGYTIPKNAQIIVNAWAIARLPSIWKSPESFEPERFLDNNVDFKGQHFELIPFGAGRRICPAVPLAHRMVHLAVATLIHNFDWKLEVEAEEVHRAELFGLSLRRAVPLKAVPIK